MTQVSRDCKPPLCPIIPSAETAAPPIETPADSHPSRPCKVLDKHPNPASSGVLQSPLQIRLEAPNRMPAADDTEAAALLAAGRAALMARLEALGIATTTVDHPAVFTVAESAQLERSLTGGHTKNLFLKDDKGALLLLIAESSTRVDLKSVSRRLGFSRFSFGKPELMQSVLGVTPGSVTAFAVMNAPPGSIRVAVDANLMRHGSVNCHPMTNTATTNIARDDLLRFIRSFGHEPVVVTVTADG